MTRRTVIWLIGTSPLLASSLLEACTAPSTAHPAAVASPIPAALAPGGTLEHYVQHLAAQDLFSGTILVAKGAQPILARAYGMANKAQGLPNRVETIYATGSVAKTFTAVAIVQLAQRGKLAFQDHLGKYLSGFPASIANTVTLHQLLTHTSGMGDFQQTPQFRAERGSWKSATQTMDGLMTIIQQQPLLFPPGAQYSYSNSGYVTLGRIVAQVSGMDYYDYIHQHIFQAAGMSSSRFYTRPERAQNPNIAHPYSQRGASGQSTNGPRTDVSNLMTFIGSPAGDAYTTVEDMLRYSQALQSHLLLDASHTDLLMTGKVPFRAIPWHQNEKYAYGLAESTVNGQRLVGHDGGANGIAMQFDMFPSLGWTVVILSNYDPGTNFNALVKEAEELVTQS